MKYLYEKSYVDKYLLVVEHCCLAEWCWEKSWQTRVRDGIFVDPSRSWRLGSSTVPIPSALTLSSSISRAGAGRCCCKSFTRFAIDEFSMLKFYRERPSIQTLHAFIEFMRPCSLALRAAAGFDCCFASLLWLRRSQDLDDL